MGSESLVAGVEGPGCPCGLISLSVTGFPATFRGLGYSFKQD